MNTVAELIEALRNRGLDADAAVAELRVTGERFGHVLGPRLASGDDTLCEALQRLGSAPNPPSNREGTRERLEGG